MPPRQSGTFQAAMLAADDDRRITTEIVNATVLLAAEDDHQQYPQNPWVTVELAEWRLSAAGSIALRTNDC